MADDEIPPETAAHFAAGGPADVTERWVRAALVETDLPKAWLVTDPDFRLARVQSWMLAELDSDDDELADRVVSAGHALGLDPDDVVEPSWYDFEDWCIPRWRAIWHEFTTGDWGFYSKPELVGPGLEIVTLAPHVAESYEVGPDRPVPGAMRVVLRNHDATWLVAGLSSHVAIPGWPPSEQRVG